MALPPKIAKAIVARQGKAAAGPAVVSAAAKGVTKSGNVVPAKGTKKAAAVAATRGKKPKKRRPDGRFG